MRRLWECHACQSRAEKKAEQRIRIVNQILDLLDGTTYHEMEPITDPLLMRAGGMEMDLITDGNGYVYCLMQGDQMMFGEAPNNRWYKVDQNVTSPIYKFVAQYFDWEE